MDESTQKIRVLNDRLRTQFIGGQVLLTSGIQALDEVDLVRVVFQVQNFDDFNPDNDPHGEHDFGAVTIGNHKVFWKIDYYDLKMEFGSDDPADESKTRRVMTIMLAEEY